MSTRRAKKGNLVVAVDLGMTSSAVSYVLVPEGVSSKTMSPSTIEIITNYPNCVRYSTVEPMQNEAPTELIYSRSWDLRTLWNSKSGGYMLDDDAVDDHVEHDDRNAAYTRPRWGYEVHRELGHPPTHSDPSKRPVFHFKALLGKGKNQAKLRKHCSESLRNLHRHLVDESKFAYKKVLLPVIIDYLTFLLQHTKNEILKERFEIGDTEMVLCVPDIWDQQACRDMQFCMAEAMDRVGFPGVEVKHSSISKVFLISEPEAAATYILAITSDISVRPFIQLCVLFTNVRRLQEGQIFMLLDIGGGTVDAITYKVTQQWPLRLQKVTVEPGGDTCGAVLLNQAFRDFLYYRLKNETYLETNGTTIKGIIEGLLWKDFEYMIKRNFHAGTTKTHQHLFVQGLRGDRHKDFNDNEIIIRYWDLDKMFFDVFGQVEKVMESQLIANKDKGQRVDKVIPIGGFAASFALREHLEKALDKFNTTHHWTTEWHVSREIERGITINAVALGASLRALDKENGPERKARSSYGLIRYELLGPEHGKQTGHYNRFIRAYQLKTIYWVIQKNQLLPPGKVFEYPCLKQFDFYDKKTGLEFKGPFECAQDIYVSDTAYRNHYGVKHQFNRNTFDIGGLEFDVTHLFEAFTLRLPKHDVDGNDVAKKHWEFRYKIVFYLDGLNVRCCAVHDDEVLDELNLNIAPGLNLGVK
ncbi:hypothetical protein FSARC_4841 [Fusarium sarcochroum]|uniref:Uncharacterized protein n=1 Tax=Fusarium sarcochroum TaxID=1208366 RepID=A0A8H4U0U4_9HYPO|nr:hypothetical protein FSARC_4841 [Fusarium sarcochroum]